MGGNIFAKETTMGKHVLNEEVDWQSVEEVDYTYEKTHGVSIYEDLGIKENFGTYAVDTSTLSRVISRVEQVAGDVEQDAEDLVKGFLEGCRNFCLDHKIGRIYMVSTD
jgi:hypothetical protein